MSARPYVATLESMKEFSAEKMKKVNLFDTSLFFMDLYCLEPGQFQKAHTHDGEDKVYVVLEGEAEFIIGEDRFSLGARNAVLAEHPIYHGVENKTDERATLLVFMTPNPNRK